MSETLRVLQLTVEAVREETRALSLDGGAEAVEEMKILLAAIHQTEAQLAGVRLEALGEAQLSGQAAAVVDQERNTPRLSSAEAAGNARLSRELTSRFWVLSEALHDGALSVSQARAIIHGLKKLPGHLGPHQLEQCQREMLTHCDTLGPDELRTLATRLWELMDPEAADDAEAARLAREERRAHAGRAFRLSPDHHGSMRITGQLPVADAAQLSAVLDALMPSAASYALDGEGTPDLDTRRADALLLLTQLATQAEQAPQHAGARPHAHITIPYEFLTKALGRAVLTDHQGESISAARARSMACDAKIIPVVLGSKSRPLDVGRSQRLVTGPIRTALQHRDQGCTFPHCTVRPNLCDAHHITPWWAGGATSTSNLVLLCPHHHRLVEPDPHKPPDYQWQVQLDDDTGRPVFVPPRHVDPGRRPRQHRRFTLDDITHDTRSEGPLCPEPEPWQPPPIPALEHDPWAQTA